MGYHILYMIFAFAFSSKVYKLIVNESELFPYNCEHIYSITPEFR